MRLIDADALKRDLRQYFTEGVLEGVSAKLAFHQILHDIDNAPTVEPESDLVKVMTLESMISSWSGAPAELREKVRQAREERS